MKDQTAGILTPYLFFAAVLDIGPAASLVDVVRGIW
jgi:hypothetical protein